MQVAGAGGSEPVSSVSPQLEVGDPGIGTLLFRKECREWSLCTLESV